MKNLHIIRLFVLLAVLATSLSGTAMAQSRTRSEPIASVAFDLAEVRWQPHVDGEHDGIVLTVSAPDGEVVRRAFKAGKSPSFNLVDEKGNRLVDGQYTYELVLVPNLSREVKEALAAARERGDADDVLREMRRSGQVPAETVVQTGSFRIERGSVMVGGSEASEPEHPAPRGGSRGQGGIRPQDVVTPDDIIVQGSACIGLDCVNGEAFGFDTIKMKENNTRIKFEDTSVGAFPTTDWQLTANDSAAGGANKFSIEDITGVRVPFTIIAGAPTNSVFVDSTGRLGLRTSTPVLDVHTATGNTPAMRFEQNGTGGFTAQTWDVAGNEANFFIRDVTGGSRLPFRIVPGALTNSIHITSSGNVGLLTASAGGALHIANNGPQWSSSNYGSNLVLRDGAPARNPAIGIFDSANANPWAIANTGGVLRISQMPALGNVATAPTERLVITAAGNVGIGTSAPAGKIDVNGTIFQRGLLLFADYVFEPEYKLESIEDHAAFMWDKKHLPAVGAKTVDEHGREVVEIGARMRGMLEELEKAHIYISTLSDRVSQKDAELAKLAQQNAELAERLARIEAMLSASKSEKK